MFLQNNGIDNIVAAFLHVCGGVSISVFVRCLFTLFSPRMWRCFCRWASRKARHQLFSTYVEVFLRISFITPLSLTFLHVCGGVSKIQRSCMDGFNFSPRMWRCFSAWSRDRLQDMLFSTYVEVFLLHIFEEGKEWTFLHVCGGVSKSSNRQLMSAAFLHVCGGVSYPLC